MQRTKCLHLASGGRGAKDYLKFTAQEASTIALVKVGNPVDVSLVTSLNGAPWQAYTTGNTISLNEGDELRMRAATVNNALAANSNNYHNFVMTGKVAASGDVMSMLDSTLHAKILQGNNAMSSLFRGCTALITAPRLGVSGFYGTGACERMYQDCTALVSAPAFEITQCGYLCLNNMFRGCTALVSAPAINAGLAYGCYTSMFNGCTALIDASGITLNGELQSACFYQMFKDCTSLLHLPSFSVTTTDVPAYALEGMFQGCTALIDARAMSIHGNILDARDIFQGCTALKYPPTLSFNGIGNYGLYHAFQFSKVEDASTIQISGEFGGHALEGCFGLCSEMTTEARFTMSRALDTSTWVAAYSGCSSLSAVHLDFQAHSAADWQNSTFQYCLMNCNAITDIYLGWEAWPDSAMVSGMFSWPNKSGVTLHVKPTLDISSLSTYGIPASWAVVQDA